MWDEWDRCGEEGGAPRLSEVTGKHAVCASEHTDTTGVTAVVLC